MTTRIERLQAKFAGLSIDSFLVSSPSNQRYLVGTSVESGDGYLLVTQNDAVFITDARYEAELASTMPAVPKTITRDYLQAVDDALEAAGATVLGIEDSLTLAEFEWLDEHLMTDIVPLKNVIDELRQVKEPAEVAAIRRATALTSEGVLALLEVLHAGMTERQAAQWLERWMQDHGATGPSFGTIVASGVRSAWPHGQASDKVLATGELVTIDCGFYVDGYTSDLTRTVALGDPGAELTAAYRAVQTAQEKIMAAVRPGATGDELDVIGRQYLTDQGYGPAFIHGTGHGIGLDIHEGPNIGRGWPDVLAPNEVITVEPGVYFTGKGGIRIEDDLLVTQTGHEILTTVPRNLIIL
ncbi:MAG: Xaa-Pro peptidase family protein [Levilactobacillus sp.]|jgi:Xaa-Pro aminopeptidase|uniref:M24 family metallopeptidase n=1 Tax=Levilactobacillus sp. TaxID=2767919 RepID=UPI0025905575|nr:Xaa-Pro peptidase family protein [Levilactobacillus sp.]MCH4123465.1 Xaa-Pro peptidase family protein [Levilactobacillus sp.]MCI1552397.1 Xaa-Pro peptidase family protein [Levilactobacillus sp.]MCI1598643.1 Xaa-Pro peptidase family protein [Levilactobacillus sp.]MCI1606883.1 Xaa-Pro peptidase family protein [Levilactobacillus sp.]